MQISPNLEDKAFRLVTGLILWLILIGGGVWVYSALTGRTLGGTLLEIWPAVAFSLVAIVFAALRKSSDSSS